MYYLIHLTDQAGISGVLCGASIATVAERMWDLFAKYAATLGCKPSDIVGSFARRCVAFVVRRSRGRHRMWRNYALQQGIRSDFDQLNRWS